ncbi:MAG: serine--tRNA ligase [Candidatus Diapherotrites archaeon]|nr:serine--tRNA ligase [Candidatus Diapherotrites archaeon]
MIDLNRLRAEPETFRRDFEKRGAVEKKSLVGMALELDKQHRECISALQDLRRQKNELSSQVESLKKQKTPVDSVLSKARKLPQMIKELEDKQKKLSGELHASLLKFPNLLDDSVPPGKSDADNVVVRSFLSPREPGFELMHHGEFAVKLNGADFERAVKISGSGFYFLKNDLARMEMAVQQFGFSMLLERGFSLISVPLVLKRKSYEGVTDLADFENVMYKVEGEDLYLVATSEHPMAAMYAGEIVLEEDLPIKLCGVSACFRREVGKHGLDERGLFRVHQFNKVEQFVFCRPEESYKLLEELVSNAENFLKKLEIPFQTTNVCTGDIGTVAAKKYDVNGWSPREKKFIELMSVSNCTSYQSRRLGVKYRQKGLDKDYVHTLNGTLVATARMLRVILENYQKKDGSLEIPKALRPFMGGQKEIKVPVTKH